MWTKYGLITYLWFMATIKFFIQSDNDPAGIYVRLREGAGIDAKAKTKYSINASDWSDTKGQPKNLKDAGFKKLYADLTKFRAELLSHYNSSTGKTPISSQWLKDFINPPKQEEGVPLRLVSYFDYYAAHKKYPKGSST